MISITHRAGFLPGFLFEHLLQKYFVQKFAQFKKGCIFELLMKNKTSKHRNMKKYAITIEHQGAVVVEAKTKKEAVVKLQERGYNISNKDVYLY